MYVLNYEQRKYFREHSQKYRDTHREQSRTYMRNYMRLYWKNNPEQYAMHLVRMKDAKKSKKVSK